VSLDFGFVILIGAALSYLGLGVQPPTPDLGTMVANGADFLPARVFRRGHGEKVAEQFICPVNQVYIHVCRAVASAQL